MDENLRVCNLIDRDTGHWKLDMIRGVLSEENIKAIETMPILGRRCSDVLIWPPFEKTGMLTVRSA